MIDQNDAKNVCLHKRAFLCGRALNLTLQGKLKMLPDLVQSAFAFVIKLKLFKTHIQRKI